MKREELEKLGLEKEAIDSIMALNGKDIEAHKAKVAATEAERDGLKGQLDEAAKAIDGFKAMDIEGVKKSADEWKTKAEQAKVEADKKLYDYKFDTRLEAKLKNDFKVKNPKRIVQDLDKSMLKYSEEKDDIEGNLADQIKPIQEKEDYLFESDIPAPKIVSGGGNKPIENQDIVLAAARVGAGLKP